MGTARNLMITSWTKEAGDSPWTLAVPGIKLTGWWPGSPPSLQEFGDLLGIWQEKAIVKVEIDRLEDPDDTRHQVCAYVRIHQYPEHWLSVIRDSLKYFVDRGAAISWAGGWECFLQYSDAEKFAGCYAAYTRMTDLVCSGDLDDTVRYLDQLAGASEQLHAGVANAKRDGGSAGTENPGTDGNVTPSREPFSGKPSRGSGRQ